MEDAKNFEHSQGLIAQKIGLDHKRLDSNDPRDVVQGVVEFVTWAFLQARLRRGEFPREAMIVHAVDYYCAQVLNGGHRQFAFNSKMSQATVRDISAGLQAFGTPELAAVWAEFLAMLKANPVLAQTAIQESAHLGKKIPELRVLDRRFYAVEGDKVFCQRMAGWLRSQSLLKGFDAAGLQTERAGIIARNRYFAARLAQAAAQKAAADAKNPLLVAAKALCARVGLTFQGLMPAGAYTKKPNEVAWGVRTAQGLRFVLLGSEGAILYLDPKRTKQVARLNANELRALT